MLFCDLLKRLMLVSVCSAVVGCSTSAKFTIPNNTALEIGERPMRFEESTTVKMWPFFWHRLSGIPYKLWRKSEVVQEGVLDAKFRISSIFWPPLSTLYWPVGFAYPSYDLTKGSVVSNK